MNKQCKQYRHEWDRCQHDKVDTKYRSCVPFLGSKKRGDMIGVVEANVGVGCSHVRLFRKCLHALLGSWIFQVPDTARSKIDHVYLALQYSDLDISPPCTARIRYRNQARAVKATEIVKVLSCTISESMGSFCTGRWLVLKANRISKSRLDGTPNSCHCVSYMNFSPSIVNSCRDEKKRICIQHDCISQLYAQNKSEAVSADIWFERVGLRLMYSHWPSKSGGASGCTKHRTHRLSSPDRCRLPRCVRSMHHAVAFCIVYQISCFQVTGIIGCLRHI